MAILNQLQLKTEVNNWIKTNNQRTITGQQMNTVLIDIIDSMFNRIDNIDLVGMTEYKPTFPYKAGMGCFYDKKVMQAIADTTGAYDATKWRQVTGVVFISQANLIAARTAGELNVHVIYYVNELNYMVRAMDSSNLCSSGIHIMGIAKTSIAIWSGGTSNPTGTVRRWNNEVYITLSGTQSGSSPDADPTGWQLQPVFGTANHQYEVLVASIDIVDGWKYWAKDSRGNEVYFSRNAATDLIVSYDALKRFAWGNDNFINNKVVDSICSVCNYGILKMRGCDVVNSKFIFTFVGIATSVTMKGLKVINTDTTGSNFPITSDVSGEIIDCVVFDIEFPQLLQGIQIRSGQFQGSPINSYWKSYIDRVSTFEKTDDLDVLTGGGVGPNFLSLSDPSAGVFRLSSSSNTSMSIVGIDGTNCRRIRIINENPTATLQFDDSVTIFMKANASVNLGYMDWIEFEQDVLTANFYHINHGIY